MSDGRPAKRAITLACLLLGALCLVLAGVSFQRKLASFQPLGFRWSPAGDHLRVLSVDRPETGMREGDRVLLVDGQAVSADARTSERQLRTAESSRLVLLRGEELVELDYRRLPVAIDLPYLILALLGVVYFAIGLFTLWRTEQGRLFFLWTLASAVVYVFSPCLLYTSPSPRDRTRSRMPSSA